MRSLIRVVLMTAAVGMILATAGCVSWIPPDIQTPASWQGVEALSTTVVTLQSDNAANLIDFPQGVTQLDENGDPCLAATGANYTGEAHWRPLDPYAIEIRFEDSAVTISSAPPVLGSQDWSELRWREYSRQEISTL